jgi:NAD(P)-dependent dehydrogenase (short-subunit alcohol dehydrogenase family)
MANSTLRSFPPGGLAVVAGAAGGMGAAFVRSLESEAGLARVAAFSRSTEPPLDVTDEHGVARCAAHAAGFGLEPRLVIAATGFLHGGGFAPEKALRQLDPAHMAKSFAVNAIGPALLMKHFLPLLPRQGKAVFAALSAKVGSIGDNQLGGWHSYRASKAALNQLIRTAAIELKLRHPEAICVALHPGTVDTGLSAPFARTGLAVRSADAAAQALLAVIDRLTPADSGGFFDYTGMRLPW